MKLLIVNRSGLPVPRKFLQWWVAELDKAAARHIPAKRFRDRELVLVFLPKKEAQKLNRAYRGKDYATDILSFDGEGESLGELVISPEVIRRQAREHGLKVREELAYMVTHGFLHLLGFDHENSPRQAKRMFDLQDRLFEYLFQKFEAARSNS